RAHRGVAPRPGTLGRGAAEPDEALPGNRRRPLGVYDALGPRRNAVARHRRFARACPRRRTARVDQTPGAVRHRGRAARRAAAGTPPWMAGAARGSRLRSGPPWGTAPGSAAAGLEPGGAGAPRPRGGTAAAERPRPGADSLGVPRARRCAGTRRAG